ncbi:methyl-accepting chemotaxis protein [Pantoea agglomerans]|jgi:methyl-accepting chemotaxis protein-1 (serine sensor receptor)|uniref:methyl-accepting chemotaxis protein n=1 Tax=Enterobacter agglomerans TaxID=549 RepID=UPI002D770053|nr:methyl-accepting chemotaxis protein [Pantoea agglomerans]WRO92084.1 methyl-accepting chemotaxis protein [Pantoea agglomerans]
MLNRIKVVNAIILILCLLGCMQLLTGALSLHASLADREGFRTSQNVSKRLKSFTDAWINLNQTRIALNRGMLRLQMNEGSLNQTSTLESVVNEGKQLLAQSRKDYDLFISLPVSPGTNPQSIAALEKDYLAYSDILDKALSLTMQNKLDDILRLNIQKYQIAMQSSYSAWRFSVEEVSNRGVSENKRAFVQMLWTLGSVMVLVVIIIMIAWTGLRKVLIRPLEENIRQISAIAQGDLTQPIRVEGDNEMSVLSRSIRQMQESLITTVSAVRSGADAIYSGAGEISSGSNDLSSRTEQQAASLEETAASMEQLTATVRLNADNAREASKLAVTASDKASKGGEVVSQVVVTMNDIASSSGEISAIINVIDGIAFQTNILALNAAVEAARAGEQGRGFAVVAGEVRSLAQRSALAAKEIKDLIQKSATRIEEGSSLVQRAGESMTEIVSSVIRVTDIMGEIASASDEQSRGIEQVGIAVNEMDSVTQQNAALVEESAAAASALEEQARTLIRSVSAFQLLNENTRAEVPLRVIKNVKYPEASVERSGEWMRF